MDECFEIYKPPIKQADTHHHQISSIRQLTVPEVDTSLGLSIKAYPEGLPEGYALIRRPRLVSTEGTVGCIMCAMNFVAICH